MAEIQTPYLKLIKPEVGGSYDIWGNRLNDDLSTLDAHALLWDKVAFSALQNGSNLADIADPNDPTKVYNLGEQRFRVAQELLFYSDSANQKQTSADEDTGGLNKDGLLISQGFLWDFLETMFPIGTIVPWAALRETPTGDPINMWDPDIWHLADGTSVVIADVSGPRSIILPNLKQRFIIGADPGAADFTDGKTGGSTDHVHDYTDSWNATGGTKLGPTQIPRQRPIPDPSGTDSGAFVARIGGGDSRAQYDLPTKGTVAAGDALSLAAGYMYGNAAGGTDAHYHNGQTYQQRPWNGTTYDAAGTNLLPPFVALAYLVKVGRFRKLTDPVP